MAQARALNPDLPIIARSHSEEETEHLKRHGATHVIMGEDEIAMAMLADVPGDSRARAVAIHPHCGCDPALDREPTTYR